MRKVSETFLDPEVSSKLSKTWGIDESAEINGFFKFSGRPSASACCRCIR